MKLSVKLDTFEGPLDLLLHLIDKNKVNIYDIPIAQITDQYMEYVGKMEKEDLELVSEFLVMAATLLSIKAKMLLPAEKDEEGEAADPREELVARLVEYKLYKTMAQELKECYLGADRTMFKEPTIPREVAAYQEPVDLDGLLDGITLQKLQDVFQMVMRRQVDKIDPIRSKFGNIKQDPVPLCLQIQGKAVLLFPALPCAYVVHKRPYLHSAQSFFTICFPWSETAFATWKAICATFSPSSACGLPSR